jgi:tryptophan synthase beta chain
MAETTKFLLTENDIPNAWYNIASLFPMEVIKQEVATDRYIDIPGEVLDVYRLWRPTPLYRAHRLEYELELPENVRIFYKYEGTSPAGSHKPNTAVPQAYYSVQEGVTRIATETGAGQWGSAMAMACAFYGLDLKVYMVKISYQQKPYRRALMEAWGAQCVPSPSQDTNAGRGILAEHPDSTGSLGIAISEAVEDAATHDDTKYALGSVLNHVLLHQTVIGQEAVKQMEMAGAWPDVIVGCVGGGSNFAGLTFPFIKEKLAGRSVRIVAAEPAACPTLTRGTYAYDFGDTSKLTPLVKMYTLGHGFIPAGIHAGGLRYHGAAPLVSHLLELGLIEAVAVKQRATFEAAITFGRSEGIIPAPESAHAIRAAIEEANTAKEAGEAKTVLIGLSGHGNFDLAAYDAYLSGSLEDYEHPQEAIDEALADLPMVTV